MVNINAYKTELEKGIEIRVLEEKLLSLFSEGKVNGTVHTCIGQELIPVFIEKHSLENDFVLSNHRGHGHFLAKTHNFRGLLSEIMGKDSGVSGGIGGSQHLYSDFFLSNGIQAGMSPISLGIAMHFKKHNLGNISKIYIGDGTFGEGLLYESLNLASVWSLPCVFIVENNGIAQSTLSSNTISGTIKQRAKSFEIKYFHTNTLRINDLDDKCKKAINYCRINKKPVVLEIETSRLKSHSKGDDNRDEKQIEKLVENDIISNITKDHNNEFSVYREKFKKKIDELCKNIEDEQNLEKIDPIKKINGSNSNLNLEPKEGLRFNKLINKSLEYILTNYDSSVIIGEDIEWISKGTKKGYGGAFKVTKDLSLKFSNRVKNTPISEQAIVGLGVGYSLMSNVTIVEIMFGDFCTLIFDQIFQHLSKLSLMYGKNFNIPLIIRTPMGGRRGYGPTHSQSIEKFFLGIPNVNVIALHHRISPELIFKNMINTKKSFLLIENKILYTLISGKRKIPTASYIYSKKLFPALHIKSKSFDSNIIIFCYGYNLEIAENVVKDTILNHEVFIEIYSPTIISEINNKEISKIIHKKKLIITIEEGPGFASWSSEIITNIYENGAENIKIKRFFNKNIIPSSKDAEQKLLVSEKHILNYLDEYL